MLDFLLWVLLLPVSILLISLYFIIYQFVFNQLEVGLNALIIFYLRMKAKIKRRGL